MRSGWRNGSLWAGLALALLLVAGVAGFLILRRRRQAVEGNEAVNYVEEPGSPDGELTGFAAENATGAPAAPEIVPVAPQVSAPAPTAPAALPRIDIAFQPMSASATDAQAVVEYVLTVANSGDAPARRVRVDARMFAMGDGHDAQLADFFAEPAADAMPVASVLPPGASTELRAQVTLPRSAVRPIQMGERSLFVPLVAFNLLFESGEDGVPPHEGNAMASYVVGRENRPPTAKMAPIRLDQGPRIYRQVGQRAHQPERAPARAG